MRTVLDARRRLPRVVSAASVADLPRVESLELRFTIPDLWRSEVACNPHAAAAAREVLAWFSRLGCSDKEVARAERFDVAKYVGVAFPYADAKRTELLAKFISLWLLWDDVHVESRASRWCLDEAALASASAPSSFSRFDRGWWELFRELADRRSAAWVRGLSAAMKSWDEAAAIEAQLFAVYEETGELPAFETQLELRVATIGMAPTIFHLEDINDHELPRSFHELAAVKRLKWLSGLLVGLGNDIFSFGKDLAEGQPNLASNLILNAGLGAREAVARLVRMHDEGVRELDDVASDLEASDSIVARWVRDLRFATLGFTVWESQAPRYAEHKVIVGDEVIEPLLFAPPGGRRDVIRVDRSAGAREADERAE